MLPTDRAIANSPPYACPDLDQDYSLDEPFDQTIPGPKVLNYVPHCGVRMTPGRCFAWLAATYIGYRALAVVAWAVKRRHRVF